MQTLSLKLYDEKDKSDIETLSPFTNVADTSSSQLRNMATLTTTTMVDHSIPKKSSN